MPLYLERFSYSPGAMKALVGSAEDRSRAAAEAAESLGAKVVGFWYSFGEFDGVLLLEAPDTETAAAQAALVAGSGSMSRLETTELLTVEQAREAARKAAAASYRPPGE